MSMTTQNFYGQTRPAAQPDRAPVDGATDNPVALNPDVEIKTPDNTIAAVRPVDSNWNHCDDPNTGRWPGKNV